MSGKGNGEFFCFFVFLFFFVCFAPFIDLLTDKVQPLSRLEDKKVRTMYKGEYFYVHRHTTSVFLPRGDERIQLVDGTWTSLVGGDGTQFAKKLPRPTTSTTTTTADATGATGAMDVGALTKNVYYYYCYCCCYSKTICPHTTNTNTCAAADVHFLLSYYM